MCRVYADMRRDIQEIFRATPHSKQVMMFSATLSKEIRPVCKKFMQDVIIPLGWRFFAGLCRLLSWYNTAATVNTHLLRASRRWSTISLLFSAIVLRPTLSSLSSCFCKLPNRFFLNEWIYQFWSFASDSCHVLLLSPLLPPSSLSMWLADNFIPVGPLQCDYVTVCHRVLLAICLCHLFRFPYFFYC